MKDYIYPGFNSGYPGVIEILGNEIFILHVKYFYN